MWRLNLNHVSKRGYRWFTIQVWQHHYQSLINSLAPGKFEWNIRHVIFKQILVIDVWGIFCEIVLIRMSLDFTDDGTKPFPESILTQVSVAIWCHEATMSLSYIAYIFCWAAIEVPCSNNLLYNNTIHRRPIYADKTQGTGVDDN